MKVSIVRGGGYAGLVTTSTVDSAELPPEDAEELKRRVDQAGAFHLPEKLAAHGREADRFSYELTFDDGERTHTVRAAESALPDDVRSLIAWINERVKPRAGRERSE
ncbi:MAG: hypothetical protein QOG15_3144 [Solirubrobacteraceae bacterium]|nr:hypothetical protein [Solirubrobacteraceae bacterium]